MQVFGVNYMQNFPVPIVVGRRMQVPQYKERTNKARFFISYPLYM